MPLDDLVKVIETLKQRITSYGQTFNETQTRMALIDPLLTALGWDVSDPEIVTPEYRTDVGWADYALRGPGNKPAAVVEAKRLGSFVENHLDQVVNYCIQQGIAYAAVTDGSHWQMYRTFDPLPLAEKRVLDVQIGNMAAYECALKFLLLWQPNLESGQPVTGGTPILSHGSGKGPAGDEGSSDPPAPPDDENWISLAQLKSVTGTPAPTAIRFSGKGDKEITRWWCVLFETAEWLVGTGKLTSAHCPLQFGKGKRYVINGNSKHSDGQDFNSARQLSNGLFCETHLSSNRVIMQTRALLQHFGQDPAAVWVKNS